MFLFLKNIQFKLDVVAMPANSAWRRLRHEESHEFQASLDYIAIPCLRK
jgi:hypothetical protein